MHARSPHPVRTAILALALTLALAPGPATGALAVQAGQSCRIGTPVTGTVAAAEGGGFAVAGVEGTFRLAGLVEPVVPGAGTAVILHVVGEADRYGMRPVQAFDAGGWVQGRALREGRARALPVETGGACRDAHWKAEQRARSARRGGWKSAWRVHAARKPDALRERVGTFSVIVGTVRSVGVRERRIYLNFGTVWRKDVTGILATRGRGVFKGDRAEMEALKGRRVRLRGMLEWRGGPLIRLFDRGQIEVDVEAPHS